MNIAMVDDNQADLDKMKGALEEYGAANGMEIAFHALFERRKAAGGLSAFSVRRGLSPAFPKRGRRGKLIRNYPPAYRMPSNRSVSSMPLTVYASS